ELLLPERITQDHAMVFARLVLPRQESPSDLRAHAQQRKEIRGNCGAIKPDGIAEASEVQLLAVRVSSHFHRVQISAHGHQRALRIPVRDGNQAIWLLESQRLKQYPIHQAEDRSVDANAESERDHGHGSEAGVLGQHSHPITQVLPKSSHGLASLRYRRYSLDLPVAD